MKIEFGKEYRTRDGRKVRILATDRRDYSTSNLSIVGLLDVPDSTHESVICWNSEGEYYEPPREEEHPLDLVEDLPSCYLNVYRDGRIHEHRNKEEAEAYAGCGRVSCIKVEIVEGRYDD